MLPYIYRQLEKNNFKDLNGHLSCKLPISIEILNELLSRVEENVRSVRKIEVLDMEGDTILLNVVLGSFSVGTQNFDLIDRELTLKIKRVLGPPNYPIQMEIVKGTRKVENRILEFLFSRKLNNSLVDFERRRITFRHDEIFESPGYRYLLNRLERADIVASENVIFFNLDFNFDGP